MSEKCTAGYRSPPVLGCKVYKCLQIKAIMREGGRRLAAVVSSFGCEMRANYIKKYLC